MTRRLIGALSLAAVLGFVPAAGTTFVPAVSAQDSTKTLVTDMNVKGLKVLFKRRPGSQTVAAGMFFVGGSRNLTASTAGLEAFMLDVATEATVSYPRERMRRELASTGTSLGAGITYDYSVISLASTRQLFDKSWDIFVDSILHPSFAQDDVERVRVRMLAALNERDTSPDSLIDRLQAQVAYAGHPYENDPHGSAETVQHFSIEDLRKLHDRLMQTSRMLLVVVGDLDAADLQQKAETAFGSVPRGAAPLPPVPPLSFSQPTIKVTARDLPINWVNAVYAAPPLTSPDIYPLRVATSLLEDRVFEEVRVKRSLSYAPDAFLGSQGANVGGISFTSTDPNATVTIMLDEIAKLQTQDARPDEIRAVAQQFLTKSYLAEESSAAQVGVLAQAELLGGGWSHLADALPRIREVTPADVRRVANTYMRNLQFVVAGNPSAIDAKAFTRR